MKKTLKCEPGQHQYREASNAASIFCPRCGDTQSLVGECQRTHYPYTIPYWPQPYWLSTPPYYTWTVGSGVTSTDSNSTAGIPDNVFGLSSGDTKYYPND
jgi:hypothetical protein